MLHLWDLWVLSDPLILLHQARQRPWDLWVLNLWVLSGH
jgi:hypothetical protein